MWVEELCCRLRLADGAQQCMKRSRASDKTHSLGEIEREISTDETETESTTTIPAIMRRNKSAQNTF